MSSRLRSRRLDGCATGTMNAPAATSFVPTLNAASARRTSKPCVASSRASRAARDGSAPGVSTYSLHRPLFALGDRGAAIVDEIAQQLLAIARRGLRRRDRRGEVVQHAVAIREIRIVLAPEHQPARRRLLVGHADGAVEDRPGFAVARIEGVVDLADEIAEAARVEAIGVGLAERLEPARLRLGDVRVRADRPAARSSSSSCRPSRADRPRPADTTRGTASCGRASRAATARTSRGSCRTGSGSIVRPATARRVPPRRARRRARRPGRAGSGRRSARGRRGSRADRSARSIRAGSCRPPDRPAPRAGDALPPAPRPTRRSRCRGRRAAAR